MQARGADARGVAVIDEKTPESELDAMGQAGVRGIRLNRHRRHQQTRRLAVNGCRRLSSVKSRNWHIQLNTNLAMIAMTDLVATAPVPCLRPFRRGQGGLGPQQPGT